VLSRLILASWFGFGLLSVRAADVSFTLTDAKDNKPVADAVVSLVPLDAPAKISPPATPVEIVQKNLELVPYVTPVVVGTQMVCPNRDNVKHALYSTSEAKRFSYPLYEPGKAEKLVLDKPGVIAMGCNIHDWMLAYIVVLDTPWFALTDATGATQIAGVPAGNYRLEIWQPRLKQRHTQPLTVTDNASPPLALKLPLGRDQRIRRKIEAGAGGYK
jgi:hypothetical protein